MLIILAGAAVCAQKIRGQSGAPQRPAQSKTSSSPQPKTERKNATTLRSSETPKGSRLALRSNGLLNDYSAYRLGNRFYVVIPRTEAPAATLSPPASGRGFDDMKVQKRGSDLVLSFRLQPGTSARVAQKYNKLDVLFETTVPPPSTSNNNKAVAVESKPANTNSATEREATAASENARAAATSTPEKEADEAGASQPVDSTPPTVGQTPAAEPTQIAQVEQRPAPPVAVAPSKTTRSDTSTGAMLTNNWFPILILAILVLTCAGLIWFTRPRQRSTAQPLGAIDARLAIKEETSSAKRLPEATSPQENGGEVSQTREEPALSWAAAMSFVPHVERESAVESPRPFTLPKESLIEADEEGAEDRTRESSVDEDASPIAASEVKDEIVAERGIKVGTTDDEQPHVAEVSEAETESPVSDADQFSSDKDSAEVDDSSAQGARVWRAVDEKSLPEIIAAFDDPSEEVRNGAAHALYNLNSDRVGSFTRVLREAAPASRLKIGSAFASSRLADACITQLSGASPVKAIEAFSLLFLMVKAGEIHPLLQAIEEHPNSEVRMAVIKLLALSEQRELLPDLRRLVEQKSLPTAVRSALMQTIYQISSQT